MNQTHTIQLYFFNIDFKCINRTDIGFPNDIFPLDFNYFIICIIN
jgi:hypothetical protein